MPLTLIPTPIGNLGDITLRALEELKNADLIACEDTRCSGLLLAHYGIKVPTTSYQKFNEKERTAELLCRLAEGQRIALISDAGTPGMSDPGYILALAAIEAGFEVDVLPGATAFVPAILMSGLIPQPFSFIGFLPDPQAARLKVLQDLKEHPFTMAIYLSPHKIEKHLTDILKVFGERRAALVREISKIYQETRRGTLRSILDSLEETIKGELVLVVEGKKKVSVSDDVWQAEAEKLREQQTKTKEIAVQIAKKYDIPKNKIKSWLLDQQQ